MDNSCSNRTLENVYTFDDPVTHEDKDYGDTDHNIDDSYFSDDDTEDDIGSVTSHLQPNYQQIHDNFDCDCEEIDDNDANKKESNTVNHVPYSPSPFKSSVNFTATAAFTLQLALNDLFNCNKASLRMYVEIISLFNAYIFSSGINPLLKLLPRKQFLSCVESIFETESMKPTYGKVTLHDNSLATVPIFDCKAMILSLLHDSIIMQEPNVADGYDIFTGQVHDNFEPNTRYGEIHTGDSWIQARDFYCGCDGQYMTVGLVIFGDKSHTDLHGSLALTPVIFTLTFFNRKARNNPRFWRLLGYTPNL